MAAAKTSQIQNRGSVILVGGSSRRMGTPKWQLSVRGESFLDRQLRIVSASTNRVVISSQTNQLQIDSIVAPEGLDVQIVADSYLESGPLEGIRAGLKNLNERGCEWAFVSAVDAPWLKQSVVERLFEEAVGFQAAIPVDGERVFGLTAVYRTDLYQEIGELVSKRELKVSRLATQFKTNLVKISEFLSIDPGLNSFKNINDPEQYREIVHDESKRILPDES